MKGWFETAGRKGDRTLDQQLRGLDGLFSEARGKSVLDVGCAEGLIALALCKRGAAEVHGIEVVASHVAVANALRGPANCTFEQADANEYQPTRSYDVVLLAVLHKLRNPSDAAARFADACRELCVVRLPPARAPVIVDARSGMQPHDIEAALARRGLTLQAIDRGTYEEWVGYFRRTS